MDEPCLNICLAFTPVKLQDYQERVAYDPNGNIGTYTRNGFGSSLAMDNLTYNYYSNTNRLSSIHDVAGGSYTTDLKDQGAGNYTYDAIGNLKQDAANGVSNINWTVYGKISSVTNGSGAINYTYDATGNRITKTVGSTTSLYVRDAQGNVLSIYTIPSGGTPQQTEVDLYGSSRLGTLRALTVAPAPVNMGNQVTGLLNIFTRGERSYELANHLGNVLATVTDKKIAVSSDGSLIASYKADVVTAQDYYPFGMQMPGRTFAASGVGAYRYGFNGKERDDEVKGAGNEIDYGMRVYDPRAGRFLSVDPLTPKYPELTPYQYASNTPIQAVDLDGKEASQANIYADVEYHISKLRHPHAPEWKIRIESEINAFFDNPIISVPFRGSLAPLDVYEYTNRNSNQKDPNIRAENSEKAKAAVVDLGTGLVLGKSISVLTKVIGAGGKAVYKYFSSSSIRFSQGSVNGYTKILESMKVSGWKGDPIDIVKMEDGIYTTIDNTRLMAAQEAGINVKANAHSYNDLIPEELAPRFANKEGELPKTWGEAVKNRMKNQNSSFKAENVSGNGTFIMPKAKD